MFIDPPRLSRKKNYNFLLCFITKKKKNTNKQTKVFFLCCFHFIFIFFYLKCSCVLYKSQHTFTCSFTKLQCSLNSLDWLITVEGSLVPFYLSSCFWILRGNDEFLNTTFTSSSHSRKLSTDYPRLSCKLVWVGVLQWIFNDYLHFETDDTTDLPYNAF